MVFAAATGSSQIPANPSQISSIYPSEGNFFHFPCIIIVPVT